MKLIRQDEQPGYVTYEAGELAKVPFKDV